MYKYSRLVYCGSLQLEHRLYGPSLIFADSWLVSQWVGIATGLSAICLSVVVDCGQTAIDRLMISSLSDRANIWRRQSLNSIEIGLAVFEQWRLQWGYPTVHVDWDRLIGHIFGSIARRKRRTAKIMAPYYRQLFKANPMVLTPLSADDPEGSFQGHESESGPCRLNGCSWSRGAYIQICSPLPN